MSLRMNRRVFGQLAAGAVASTGFVGIGRAAPTSQVHGITVVSDDPGDYRGWPTVMRRGNGELLLVCSGAREEHVCPFGRVELFRSKDDGQTWSWPRVLVDSPIDDRDAGICETAAGTLLVSTFTSLAYVPTLEKAASGQTSWPEERLKRWQAAHQRVDEATRQGLLGMWLVRSTDGGVQWSAPYRCPINSPHGPVPLSDGRLLYAGKDLWHGTSWIGVCESQDDGQTWHRLGDIPTAAGHDHANYHELHMVEAADGRLIAHVRNHNTEHNRETLQSESDDGGLTWTAPHSIGVWGLPSHLLKLADGRLLMSYGHRRAPLGNLARVSEDHGSTWSEPITISDDGTSGDLGYPSTVQLASGDLLTVWYEKMKPNSGAVLRQAVWSLK